MRYQTIMAPGIAGLIMLVQIAGPADVPHIEPDISAPENTRVITCVVGTAVAQPIVMGFTGSPPEL